MDLQHQHIVIIGIEASNKP